jgi:pyrroline-5-carboxylate reductase
MKNIIIIGAGNMGRAIAKGLLRDSENKIYFKTTERTPHYIPDFQTEQEQSRVFFSADNDFFYKIKNPWIILAVKPHLICSVIAENNDIFLQTSPIALISLAAGVTIETIKNACSGTLPIIRTMPNISVATGKGVIGYVHDTQTINDAFVNLCQILGMVYPLKTEADFHLFTALSGSSPAFFLHTIEAMAHAATMLGMNNTEAEKIVIQVFRGVSSLLQTQSPTALRQSVTSPNGTTQAGLGILMNKDLNIEHSALTELFLKTLDATQKRSQDIFS